MMLEDFGSGHIIIITLIILNLVWCFKSFTSESKEQETCSEEDQQLRAINILRLINYTIETGKVSKSDMESEYEWYEYDKWKILGVLADDKSVDELLEIFGKMESNNNIKI
ncbi:hypothetical protein VCRA2117O328_10238 [Vibrio crassostreae]|nr:hypothetical protein VCRA2117O328_10238 [Vibrio crassostreae]